MARGEKGGGQIEQQLIEGSGFIAITFDYSAQTDYGGVIMYR